MLLLPLLLLLFVASGCAALVYQIVWFQMLELTIGSSAVSIAVLLATYMGGMCLGSLGLARAVPPQRDPLRVYALLEIGIGACGLAVLWLLPHAGGLYSAIGGHGVRGLLLRGALGALCLLPPTILMGATLPAVSRWVEATPRGVSWLGLLYAGNTLGAVAGCLLAGFYLLRVHDVGVATYVAVSINVAVAGLSLWLSARAAYGRAREDEGVARDGPAPSISPVLVTIGLSGLTALSAEVVWTRLLSLQLGATVYTYSLILASVLAGLGIGSAAGSLLARSTLDPRSRLGWCQASLAAGIAWAAYLLTAVLPFQPNQAALSPSPMVAFRHGLLVSVSAVLPAALFWGASFPLALAAATRSDRDPGRPVGLVGAANTLGALVGALGTPLVAMGWLGSQRVQQALIGLAALSAALVLAPPAWTRRAGLAAIPLGLGLVLAGTVRPVPGALIGYGPGSAAWRDAYGAFVYVGEGMHSSVAVSRFANGALNYHNAGKVQASSKPEDLRLQRMLGHLTTLQTEAPESALVIGCGAGVTAGAVGIDPRVKRLTIVEIEPLVPKAAHAYFAEVNHGVVADPKTELVIDDGRHYLMTSRRRYDAITCDPFDPWTRGAAALSTREFYLSARERLNPGGTMTVWVPLYQARGETVKSEIATFLSVFPDAIVWDNVTGGGGDVVLSGRRDDAPIDLDALFARLQRPEYRRVRESLESVGFASAVDLLATFGAQGPELAAWAAGAPINTDRNLRLQYLAGIGFGVVEPERIYAEMVGRRAWPKALFTGSPQRLDALRKAILR